MEAMRPHGNEEELQGNLFRSHLEQMINLQHELAILARLMVGLHILKQMFGLSDERVCAQWVENPYFQYFYGESFFQHELPMDPRSPFHYDKEFYP